ALRCRVASAMPGPIARTLMPATPLSMLPLAARSSRRAVLISVVLGCALVPMGYIVSTDWGLLTGGVLAGTLAFVFERARKKNA
ncbi:MAG: hypothetical protein OXG62_08075, partial [Nitrospinae bacterium]|nr:hypothetical protein [Nitrospinota bacterium]